MCNDVLSQVLIAVIPVLAGIQRGEHTLTEKCASRLTTAAHLHGFPPARERRR